MYEIKTEWTPRKEQEIMLEKFVEVLESKKKFLFIDAPVGTGKSFGVILMAQKYDELNKTDNPFQNSNKFDVITNTKNLQDQYLRDFKFMRSIKGVENYRCHTHNCSCKEGMAINKLKETSCTNCSYKIAKTEFTNCKVSVTNFHMFINYYQYAPDTLATRNAKILFIDEAHLFEETFCSFIEAEISKESLEEHDVWNPEWIEDLNSLRTFKQCGEFIQGKVLVELSMQIKELAEQASKCDTGEAGTLVSKMMRLERLKDKYGRFIRYEEDWKTNWIIEVSKDKNGNRCLKLQAIWGTKYLKEIWNMYDHVVFLSGTLLDRRFFMNLVGCEMHESEFLTIESPFPVENRKIHYKPVGKMSYNEKQTTFKEMVPVIKEILEQHKDVSGVIHTGNYELADWIKTGIRDSRLLFHDSKNRETAIRMFQESKSNTVIVSPSLINGVDFKDDLSRLQIIIKIPYPNLSSEQVKQRMNSNGKWYSWKTLCDVIQSYGRSVRSETDWAITYILDANFETLLNRVNIPGYIKKAIVKNN